MGASGKKSEPRERPAKAPKDDAPPASEWAPERRGSKKVTREKKSGIAVFVETVQNNYMAVAVVLAVVFLLAMKAQEESYDYRSLMRMSLPNYYEVLGVERDAPKRDIKRVYYDLSKQWHPDKNPDCAECEKKFSKIAKAYEVLSDDRKRKAYDNNEEVFDVVESDTTDLNDADFDSLVNASQPWLIQVYTNANDDSREIRDIWERTNQYYAGVINMGRILAEKNPALCKRFKVRDLPEVIAVIDGEPVSYKGSYSLKGLTQWMSQLLRGFMKKVEDANLEKFLEEDKESVKFIHIFSKSSKTRTLFRRIAFTMKRQAIFGEAMSTTDSELAKKFKVTELPAVIVHKPGGSSVVLEGESLLAENLPGLMSKHKFGPVPKLDNLNYLELCGGNTEAEGCLLYLHRGEGKPDLTEFEKISNSNREEADQDAELMRMNFLWTPAASAPKLEASLGASGSSLVAIQAKNNQARVFKGDVTKPELVLEWGQSLQMKDILLESLPSAVVLSEVTVKSNFFKEVLVPKFMIFLGNFGQLMAFVAVLYGAKFVNDFANNQEKSAKRKKSASAIKTQLSKGGKAE